MSRLEISCLWNQAIHIVQLRNYNDWGWKQFSFLSWHFTKTRHFGLAEKIGHWMKIKELQQHKMQLYCRSSYHTRDFAKDLLMLRVCKVKYGIQMATYKQKRNDIFIACNLILGLKYNVKLMHAKKKHNMYISRWIRCLCAYDRWSLIETCNLMIAELRSFY